MEENLKCVVAEEIGEDAGIGVLVRRLREGGYSELARGVSSQHRQRNLHAHPIPQLDLRVRAALRALSEKATSASDAAHESTGGKLDCHSESAFHSFEILDILPGGCSAAESRSGGTQVRDEDACVSRNERIPQKDVNTGQSFTCTAPCRSDDEARQAFEVGDDIAVLSIDDDGDYLVELLGTGKRFWLFPSRLGHFRLLGTIDGEDG